MKNSYIITPFFLDNRLPGLDVVAATGWIFNTPKIPDGGQQERMTALHKPLRDLVMSAVQSGERPVSVAGDCCTSIGFLAGLQNAGVDPTLLWFDAHGDFNDWNTTPSGFLGGMPLAMLVGRGEQTMPRGVGLKNLAEDRAILTDARDLDPGEEAALRRSAVKHVARLEDFLEQPLPPGPLYVHFDADIIDPMDAPAMSYPAPGGPSLSLIRKSFRRLAETDQVVGVSLSAWNPELDGADGSRFVVMSLLEELVKV